MYAGPVRRGESLRPDVGVAVAIVEVFEDLLVARLAAERVHGLYPSEAFDEVHDDERDRVSRRPVCALRLVAEPPGDQPQHRKGEEYWDRELCVQHDEHDCDADDREDRRDERDDAEFQHVGERVDVGGLARDHASRGVSLVEREAEVLEVHERAASEVEDGVLSDAPDDHEERVERHCADQRDHHHRHDHRHEWSQVAAAAVQQRRDAVVDADLHEQRAGELCDGAARDEQRGEEQRPRVRTGQGSEQRRLRLRSSRRKSRVGLVDVFRGDASPAVDGVVAGQVERRVAVDVGDLVGLDHRLTRSLGRSRCSAAWLRMAA